MVRIRQHGPDNELFDMALFLPHIEKLLQPDAWQISVEWCIGESSEAIATMSKEAIIPHHKFIEICAGLHQTIDGTYSCLKSSQIIAELEAVDSSFWNIHGPVHFQAQMLALFGPA